MTIAVEQTLLTEADGHYRVTVSYWDENQTLHNSARIEVFVPVTDSISALKASALRECEKFLRAVSKG